MAPSLFTDAILNGRAIDVFNHGNMQRDFTYIDDIVEGVVRVMLKPAAPNPVSDNKTPTPGTSRAPYRLYNIGNHNAVQLLDLISALEECLGRKAEKRLLPMQPGDVPATYADIEDLVVDFAYRPRTPIHTGISSFVKWYLSYLQTVQ